MWEEVANRLSGRTCFGTVVSKSINSSYLLVKDGILLSGR